MSKRRQPVLKLSEETRQKRSERHAKERKIRGVLSDAKALEQGRLPHMQTYHLTNGQYLVKLRGRADLPMLLEKGYRVITRREYREYKVLDDSD